MSLHESFACPHCGDDYTEIGSEVTDDGLILCANCFEQIENPKHGAIRSAADQAAFDSLCDSVFARTIASLEKSRGAA